MDAKVFEKHCKDLGFFTASTIAEEFGVNQSTVSRWISDSTPIPMSAAKLLSALEAKERYLQQAVKADAKYESLAHRLAGFKQLLNEI
jgi:transcriptional regulator with XRE-family HTH domain